MSLGNIAKRILHRMGERQWLDSPDSGRFVFHQPDRKTPFDQAEFLAVDIETSGLDAETDEVLSIGFVPIVKGRIRLSDAEHHLVKPTRPVSQGSAVIHGLFDDQLESSAPLQTVLPCFLDALRGRVPVVHHAAIESRFLDTACRRLYDHPLEIRYMDTLAMEKRRMARRGQEITEGALRLSAVRARYDLPRYRAHNALVDAVAAAELFLVLALHASGKRPATVGELLI